MFGMILERLGLPKIGAPALPPMKSDTTLMGTTQPAVMPTVDVMSKLTMMAGDRPDVLQWKTSIVDLLKVLGMDSSRMARTELAAELGYPPEMLSGDQTKLNAWLQQTLLQKIAEAGGNIPRNLYE